MVKKSKKISMESGFSLIVVFLLAVVALEIIFILPTGLIEMSSGLILVLEIVGLIILLLIYLKLCEFKK